MWVFTVERVMYSWLAISLLLRPRATLMRICSSRSVSGAIGFVGLVIPHVTRMLVGSDHRRVLPVAALLMAGVFVLGTGPLKDLGLALFVGMIAGAYSSLFLAAPMYVQMREREPELAAHRRRLSRTEGSTANPQPSEEAAIEAAEPEDDSEESLLSASGTTVDPIRFGSVPGSDLPRQQPQRSTRAERKKDGR